MAHRHSLRDRVADQIIQWATSLGGELEIAAFGIASQDALALKGAADALGPEQFNSGATFASG